MSATIVSLLQRLVQIQLPNADQRSRDLAFHRICAILRSQLFQGAVLDELRIKDEMGKLLESHASAAQLNGNSQMISKASVNQQTARMEELVSRVLISYSIKQKLPILQTLLHIGAEASSPNDSANRTSTLFSASALPQRSLQLHAITPSPGVVPAPSEKISTISGISTTSSDYSFRSRIDAAKSKLVESIADNIANEVSEARLVRDLIYTFQGIDGSYIKYDRMSDSYRVVSQVGVSHSNRELCIRISELGWLYRRVCDFITKSMDRSGSVGLVEQCFCSALQAELSDYYRLIASFESQVVAALSADVAMLESSSSTVPGRSASLTLKRLLVWVEEPIHKMRLMATLAGSVSDLHGGSLASAIDSHLRHGDANVSSFVFKIMQKSCTPLFQMIRNWLFSGVLDDPFSEFFVASDSSVPKDRFWQDKYSLRTEMVPSFISDELAHNILVIGKSLNFLRTCCQDVEWMPPAELSQSPGLEYGESAALQATVDEVADIVNQRIMHVMMNKFRLQQHCFGIKKYILLSAGDFIQHLMDIISPELEKKADRIFAHNMMGFIQQAARSSNAQYDDEDTLNRLSVHILTKSQGETGWDIFSLNYRVDLPISVVLHSDAMRKGYYRMFHFLWRLKRVDHLLGRAWQSHVSDHMHKLDKLPKYKDVFRMSNMLRFEMVHFVQSLLSYIMFEVLESSWVDLCRGFEAANGLDDIIAAHDAYLKQILDRALIGGGDSERTYRLLSQLFQLIIGFAYHQDRINETVLLDLERKKKRDDAVGKRTKANQWGVSEQHGLDQSRDEEDAAWARSEVASLVHTRDTFNALLDELLTSLNELDRRHVADVGYLVFRLVGTNQFYERRRRIAEEQALLSGSKAMRTKAAELVSAQLSAIDSSLPSGGSFSASISSIAAAARSDARR